MIPFLRLVIPFRRWVALALLNAATLIVAEGQEAGAAGPKGAGVKVTAPTTPAPLPSGVGGEALRRLAFPNPYPRLQALERELKKAGVTVDWNSIYNDLARKDVDASALASDQERAQLLLGVRIADGFSALMAKSSSRLKGCAQDIKALAQVVGLRPEDISVEGMIRAMEKEDWDMVFFELGDLQQQVVVRLDTEENRSKGALMAAGAWLQGLRYATKLITVNQAKVDLSNYLRAAPIAELIAKEIKSATAETLSKPPVKAAMQTLVEVFPLMNIGRDDNIPPEKVKRIFDLATQALSSADKTK